MNKNHFYFFFKSFFLYLLNLVDFFIKLYSSLNNKLVAKKVNLLYNKDYPCKLFQEQRP